MTYEAKRVALLVEGISEVSRLIIAALTKHDIACKVMLTNEGLEALDFC